MQISLKFIRGLNHAKSTTCIKFQLLVTFSSLFTGSSILPVFALSVLYQWLIRPELLIYLGAHSPSGIFSNFKEVNIMGSLGSLSPRCQPLLFLRGPSDPLTRPFWVLSTQNSLYRPWTSQTGHMAPSHSPAIGQTDVLMDWRSYPNYR